MWSFTWLGCAGILLGVVVLLAGCSVPDNAGSPLDLPPAWVEDAVVAWAERVDDRADERILAGATPELALSGAATLHNDELLAVENEMVDRGYPYTFARGYVADLREAALEALAVRRGVRWTDRR